MLDSIWDFVFNTIFRGNIFYVLLACGAIFWLLNRRKNSQTTNAAREAYTRSTEVQKQTTGSVDEVNASFGHYACYFGENPDGSKRVINTGRYELKGETAGMAWTMQSIIRLNAANHETRSTTHIFREDELTMSLRLTSKGVLLPTGEFLMIMSTPSMRGAMQFGPREGDGFFNKLFALLVDTAAAAAISFYTNGYFGSEGKKVKTKGSAVHKSQNPEFAEKYYVIASNSKLLEQNLTWEFERFLQNWRNKNFGFVNESAIDQHGLLFTDNGLTLGAQSAIIDPEKAEILALYASEVCKLVNAHR
ncbi:MAG: hypothetical protein O9264_09715 [Leptospira sp.]|nr:hypothetical protein [Leptospira sp.]